MGRSEESNAKDLISRFIESIGIHDTEGVVPFVRTWPQIAGRDAAAHSQILDIANGAILVGVDHPAWLQKLHMDRDTIIARVRREFPDLHVRYLHFTIVDTLEFTPDRPGEPEPNEIETKTVADDTPSVQKKQTESVPVDRAEDDEVFQQHLKNLKDALEQNRSSED